MDTCCFKFSEAQLETPLMQSVTAQPGRANTMAAYIVLQ